ncbi:MAG: hypothetical protein KY395_03945 [Actinobacteria bacterium]|nr:hypothetical protein [Actinomycetota bacterium]
MRLAPSRPDGDQFRRQHLGEEFIQAATCPTIVGVGESVGPSRSTLKTINSRCLCLTASRYPECGTLTDRTRRRSVPNVRLFGLAEEVVL